MKKILWLPSWFPHDEEPLTGDFIERHAKAVSKYHKVFIAFVVKDRIKSKNKKTIWEQKVYNANLRSSICYFPSSSRFSRIDSLLSAVKYFRYYRRIVKEYIRDNGKPDLVHVHVAYRAGLIALYLKWRYNIRFVITEHWSVFYPEARPNFDQLPFFTRSIIRLIYRNASASSTVSRHLAGFIETKAGSGISMIIPNVYDETLFFPRKKTTSLFRFIHISQLNYAKNPEQLIQAISLLTKKTSLPFSVTIYGPRSEDFLKLINSSGSADIIDFRQEVPQTLLAPELASHDAIILYSRFEGQGCVVIEAFACGIPAIVSDIPSMHELVTENVTGLIVPLDNPGLLADRMLWMMQNRHDFNSGDIARYAQKRFSFDTVARLFNQFYEL